MGLPDDGSQTQGIPAPAQPGLPESRLQRRLNERIKHDATFLLTSGVAVSTVGVITPIVDITYGGRVLMAQTGAGGPFILVLWLFVGIGLYLIGRRMLGDIE